MMSCLNGQCGFQARAIRRCGELLKQIEPAYGKNNQHIQVKREGDHTFHRCPVCADFFTAQVWHCHVCDHHWPMGRDYCANCHEGKPAQKRTAVPVATEDVPEHLCRPFSRTQAATEAGLSERQRKTALRVANVPEEDFETAMEAADPLKNRHFERVAAA